MHTRSLLFLLVGLTALTACDPQPEPLPVEGLRTIDLRAALGNDDISAIGVTVEPDTGRVFFLDEFRGIYEVQSDDSVEQVLALADFPEADIDLRSNFTDFVALSPGVFALTARSNGYLLDLEAMTLTQYFCYVPGFMDEEWEDQLTHSLTYDADAGLLYAQPQTFEVNIDGDEVLLRSEIASFDVTTGADLDWVALPEAEFVAGGIAAEGAGVTLLADGAALYRHSAADGLEILGTLEAEGMTTITGLALDGATDVLWALDGDTDQLHQFRLQD